MCSLQEEIAVLLHKYNLKEHEPVHGAGQRPRAQRHAKELEVHQGQLDCIFIEKGLLLLSVAGDW